MKERNLTFDIAKGIGIVMMVMNHSLLSTDIGIYNFINSFYMPLFFLISGYFFKSGVPWKCYIKEKAKRLLFPYLLWSVFHLLIWLVMGKLGIELRMTRFQAIVGVIWNNNVYFPIAGALWFLTALFGVSVLCKFLIEKKLMWISLIILVIGLYINPFLPFSFDTALLGQAFFVFGYILKTVFNNRKLAIKNMGYLFAGFTGLLFTFVLSRFNGSVNMRECSFGKFPFLFYVTGIIGSAGIICIAKLAYGFNNSFIIKNVNRCFAYVGKESMCYLCLNQLIITVIQHILSKDNVWIHLFTCIITLCVLTVGNYLAGKLQLKWLFGEFERKDNQ